MFRLAHMHSHNFYRMIPKEKLAVFRAKENLTTLSLNNLPGDEEQAWNAQHER